MRLNIWINITAEIRCPRIKTKSPTFLNHLKVKEEEDGDDDFNTNLELGNSALHNPCSD